MAEMKYIIMAGGTYTYWTTPRQLYKVNGEPVISRTIRLLKEAGATDIYISTNDERFKECGVPLLKHDNDFTVDNGVVTGVWADAFYPCNEPACYLLGDVVFSPAAIHKIVNAETDDILFFASSPPFDDRYIKHYAEPFCFKVVNQTWFKQAIQIVKLYNAAGKFSRPPIAWELWQIINGWSINDIDFDSYAVINDYTCDIDSIEDAARIGALLYECGGDDTRL